MDRENGGFYATGSYSGTIINPAKIWWGQCEALLCCMYLYHNFGKLEYAEGFNLTLQWITQNQADWGHGEMYLDIDEFGTARGYKAGRSKTTYHNGRAILQSLLLAGRP